MSPEALTTRTPYHRVDAAALGTYTPAGAPCADSGSFPPRFYFFFTKLYQATSRTPLPYAVEQFLESLVRNEFIKTQFCIPFDPYHEFEGAFPADSAVIPKALSWVSPGRFSPTPTQCQAANDLTNMYILQGPN